MTKVVPAIGNPGVSPPRQSRRLSCEYRRLFAGRPGILQMSSRAARRATTSLYWNPKLPYCTVKLPESLVLSSTMKVLLPTY